MEYLRLIEQYSEKQTDISRLYELESALLSTVPVLAVAGEVVADASGALARATSVPKVEGEKYVHAQVSTNVNPPTSSVDCASLEKLVDEGAEKLASLQKTGEGLEMRLESAQERLAQTKAKLEVQRRLCADAYGHAKDAMLASLSRS